ncbi:hypothetical protein DMA11_19745 [Marinilabiliaceae bacterium JC017]|nr:hypothetical protein DMA11_19745 [Marinilabiliaceae bacterium JC017]
MILKNLEVTDRREGIEFSVIKDQLVFKRKILTWKLVAGKLILCADLPFYFSEGKDDCPICYFF